MNLLCPLEGLIQLAMHPSPNQIFHPSLLVSLFPFFRYHMRSLPCPFTYVLLYTFFYFLLQLPLVSSLVTWPFRWPPQWIHFSSAWLAFAPIWFLPPLATLFLCLHYRFNSLSLHCLFLFVLLYHPTFSPFTLPSPSIYFPTLFLAMNHATASHYYCKHLHPLYPPLLFTFYIQGPVHAIYTLYYVNVCLPVTVRMESK